MGNRMLTFLFAILLLISCKKAENPKAQIFEKVDVVVLNEGNFRSGNGSVSLYSSNLGNTYNKVFLNNNNGRPLGDVAQSMIQHNGKGYIVVNNSNKIEVVDLITFQSVGAIYGLNSPRYILPVGGNRAYVSDLFQDEIYVVDLELLSIIGRIESKGWTEEMVLIDKQVFVCHVDSNQLWVFDSETDTLISKVNTAVSPTSLAVDINNKLWVSCSGGQMIGFPAIIQIDPKTHLELKKLEINDVNRGIGTIKFNANQTDLFYLSESIYKLSIGDNILPTVPFIQPNNRNFYDFSIKPVSDEIFVCDAIDYQQQGVVYRYNYLGQELGSFRVGLIPGFIDFLP